MRSDEDSSYSSQEEDDQVNVGYLSQVSHPKVVKSQKNNEINLGDEPQEEDNLLRPKLKQKNVQMMKNDSCVSKVSRRPLTAAYTFKLTTPQIKRKRNDPVALFQATSQCWKKDKFLTNRANNKQGRKLQLDKRNRNNQPNLIQ